MSFKSILNHSLMISLLATPLSSFASQGKADIPCPPVKYLQEAGVKLNKAQKCRGEWTVWSTEPAFYFHHVAWRVGIAVGSAENMDKAYEIANDKLQKIAYVGQEYAKHFEDGNYSCPYGPGLVFASTDGNSVKQD